MSMSNKEELNKLKEIAGAMGLTFPINATISKLKKLIDDAETPSKSTKAVSIKDDPKAMEAYIAEQTKLVRVVINPNSPREKSIAGDWFSAGNSVLPSYRKYMLFNAPEGYHIPMFVYTALKDKTYREERVVRPKDGKPAYVEHFTLPAYNITVLDDLTEEQLEDLKTQQLSSK